MSTKQIPHQSRVMTERPAVTMSFRGFSLRLNASEGQRREKSKSGSDKRRRHKAEMGFSRQWNESGSERRQMQHKLVVFVFQDTDRTPGLSWVITCTGQQRSCDQAGGDHVTRRSDNSDLLSDCSKYKQMYTNMNEFISETLPLLHIVVR